MPGTFDIWTILLSFAVASLAGFVAFESVDHTYHSGKPGQWTLLSGITLGLGIWSMHFIGMLAWQPPFPLYYAVLPTVLSVVAAVLSSWLAMHLVVSTRAEGADRNLLLGAVMVGGGIGAMHYIGMDALKFTEPVMWSWPGVALSLVIAVFASMAAMAMFQRSGTESFSMRRQVIASLIIGVAICGMHFTGMLAMMVPNGAVSVQRAHDFSGLTLARAGVGNALLFMVFLLVASYRGKRHAAAAAA